MDGQQVQGLGAEVDGLNREESKRERTHGHGQQWGECRGGGKGVGGSGRRDGG